MPHPSANATERYNKSGKISSSRITCTTVKGRSPDQNLRSLPNGASKQGILLLRVNMARWFWPMVFTPFWQLLMSAGGDF
jgi:hypothetical protein